MKTFKYIWVIYFIGVVLVVVNAEDSELTKLMKEHEIIPDVLDEAPMQFLKVTYVDDVSADRGIELTPTQVKDPPNVEWEPETDDTYYTLLLTNPDVPSRENPAWRDWVHWLVVNIPGNQIDNGEVLDDYIGAGGRPGTGLHRYIILLFKQPGKLEFDEQRHGKTEAAGRENLYTRQFMEKYQLGTPVAGNVFLSQYDDYVPILYKQLDIPMKWS
ncbi:protein D2-like [Musca vetustissima]|uniref:protein D2-like n=1 Tax=Musca vetustissima TaxID=27455 RepID=UPI002AB76730|nr:protein D2-like [Musca vetustissima]